MNRTVAIAGLAIALLTACATSANSDQPVVRVGSKPFTESFILAEIMAQLLEDRGYTVERRLGLGGTLFTLSALRAGEIDVYPDYTGTLAKVVLQRSGLAYPEIQSMLKSQGLVLLKPFGFSNRYAIAVPRKLSAQLELRRISDLKDHPRLRFAFSHEFMRRDDGWPGLVRAYGLKQKPRNIEHAVSYHAIASGQLDSTDAYSTDGELKTFDLVLLQDDLNVFPDYAAVPLIRKELAQPVRDVLNLLAGTIDEDRMQQLNAEVSLQKRDRVQVAAGFLADAGLVKTADYRQESMWYSIGQNTLTHLKLTGIALGLACLVSISGALLVYRNTRLANSLVSISGLIQTVPSLALLVLMIPVFGLGEIPAVAALFLYALLPILRNTITGLYTVDPLVKQVATGMGFTPRQQLLKIELPLALPTLLAGIKTATILCIGTATLAAFVGAGGLGQPIVTGLALNDMDMILQGAIPAAVLALLVELLLSLVERVLIPAHLRQN